MSRCILTCIGLSLKIGRLTGVVCVAVVESLQEWEDLDAMTARRRADAPEAPAFTWWW